MFDDLYIATAHLSTIVTNYWYFFFAPILMLFTWTAIRYRYPVIGETFFTSELIKSSTLLGISAMATGFLLGIINFPNFEPILGICLIPVFSMVSFTAFTGSYILRHFTENEMRKSKRK